MNNQIDLIDDSEVCLVAVRRNGLSNAAIISALEESEPLSLLQHSRDEYDRADFYCDSLRTALESLILLGTSHIIPYKEQSDKNRALLHPFMLILRIAIFCPYDIIYHFTESLYYLITLQFSKALGLFIQSLCDITSMILYTVVILPLSCTAIIMRNIVTALDELLFLTSNVRFNVSDSDKKIDTEIDHVIYDTSNKRLMFFNRGAEVALAVLATAETAPLALVI